MGYNIVSLMIAINPDTASYLARLAGKRFAEERVSPEKAISQLNRLGLLNGSTSVKREFYIKTHVGVHDLRWGRTSDGELKMGDYVVWAGRLANHYGYFADTNGTALLIPITEVPEWVITLSHINTKGGRDDF